MTPRRYQRKRNVSADIPLQARDELHGCDLVCWCGLDEPCHADLLLVIANDPDDAD